jgi:hypothetical protein
MHGAVAVANMLITPKPHTPPPVPERVAKIIMAAPTPAPVVAVATPTPTPVPTPKPTPIVAKATPKPTPTPPGQSNSATESRKEGPCQKGPAEGREKRREERPSSSRKRSSRAKVAKNNPPPPGPKTDAPPAPTPRPFDASSVGALKALSMLSADAELCEYRKNCRPQNRSRL